MRICVDLDDVLMELNQKLLEVYNNQTGKAISIDRITTYDFYDCLPTEDADGLIKLFKSKTLWDALTPLTGAKEGLQKLINAGHKVYIVTATAPENFAKKAQLIKKYFPFFNPDNIIRMTDKGLIECHILIDDCMDQLTANTLAHKICLDYPWNRSEAKDYTYDIYRCKNWKEILEAVGEIERSARA